MKRIIRIILLGLPLLTIHTEQDNEPELYEEEQENYSTTASIEATTKPIGFGTPWSDVYWDDEDV